MGDSLLERYVREERQPQRDILYLRLYAQRIREGNDLAWEIPSVRAAVLDRIADEYEKNRLRATWRNDDV